MESIHQQIEAADARLAEHAAQDPVVRLARTPGAPWRAADGAEVWPALRARGRRWAELLRRVYAVDIEFCPRCGGEARIIGFADQPSSFAWKVSGRLMP